MRCLKFLVVVIPFRFQLLKTCLDIVFVSSVEEFEDCPRGRDSCCRGILGVCGNRYQRRNCRGSVRP